MLGFDGVTAIEERVGAVTVRFVLPEIAPNVALIVDAPGAVDVASPALLMVATPVIEELQETVDVMFAVLLSEKTPVAVNCSTLPLTILGLAGCTMIEESVGASTMNVVLPEIFSKVALIVALPGKIDVASPVLLIVATLAFPELQETVEVISAVELSE